MGLVTLTFIGGVPAVIGQPVGAGTKVPRTVAKEEFQLGTSDEVLLKSLKNKKESGEALTRVVESAADRHSVVLNAAAHSAAGAGKTEDAMFLHFTLARIGIAEVAGVVHRLR